MGWTKISKNSQGSGVDPADAMLKSEYDKNDNGIVDSAERIEDTVILDEDVSAGSLVYITAAPLTAEGLATVGNADAYDSVRRPAVGIALESGVVGGEIRILEYGLATGIDTSNYTNNDVLFLDRSGKFGTTPNAEYAEQIGSVYESSATGSIIFQRGSIDTSGVKWSYSTQAGADSIYETTVSGASSRAVITQEVGQNRPQAKDYLIFNDDVVTQPIDTDTLINPAYTITPTESNEILGFVIKPAADQTNVILSITKNSDTVWRQNIGDITNGVEKVIDMTTGSLVPIDVSEVAVNYDISFLSNDGDVQLLGDSISGKPYYRSTFWEYELVDLVSSTVPITRENVLQAASTATSQEPSAVDTPIQIEFGAAQGTPSDPIQIDALGNISVNTSDSYIFDLSLQYGRTGGAGTSVLYARVLINGTQIGSSGYSIVDNADVVVPTSTEINLTLAAGDVVTFELIRDSSGVNSGGLFLGDPTLAGWNNAPTAEIGVTRFTGQGVILPTQGDVTGPASATQNEIATYANATGKEIKSTSDYTAESGTIKRISSGNAEFQHSNGINRLILTGTSAQIKAKNSADNSTTTWTLSDSNGGLYGGSALNVDSNSGSIGYKASRNGTFRCQMYWNSGENKTHFSHNGTNSNPAADMTFSNSDMVWDFSGNKAMSLTNAGQLDVEGSAVGVTLKDDGGVARADWQYNSGTIQFGVAGFGDAAHLNLEGNFAAMIGADAGWSRLESGGTEVKADGSTGDVLIKDNGLSQIRLNNTTGNIEFSDGGGGFSDNFFGRWRLRNNSDTPGMLLHDSTDVAMGGILWDGSPTGAMRLFNGSSAAPDNEVQIREQQTRLSTAVIVNSLNSIQSQALQVNEQFSDAGTAGYYSQVPARINLLTNNGGNTPAAPETAMSLHRSGVPTEAYGNSVRFDLSRYENVSTNMRTQLDIRLGHGQPITTGEDDNTPTILSMRSNGEVSMPTTTAALRPPEVTTAQMTAITPLGIVNNTEVGLLYYGDGTAWSPLSTTVSVAGKVQVQNNIAMSGIFQTIQSGTFDYYEIDGQAATPNFTNGAWVVPADGTYIFNVRGWAFTGSGSETQSRFYIGVNGNDYVSQPNVGIDAVTKNGSGLTLSGTVRLNAGDVVRVGYSVLSGTGWEVDGFSWDVNRVGS